MVLFISASFSAREVNLKWNAYIQKKVSNNVNSVPSEHFSQAPSEATSSPSTRKRVAPTEEDENTPKTPKRHAPLLDGIVINMKLEKISIAVVSILFKFSK